MSAGLMGEGGSGAHGNVATPGISTPYTILTLEYLHHSLAYLHHTLAYLHHTLAYLHHTYTGISTPYLHWHIYPTLLYFPWCLDNLQILELDSSPS